MITPYRFSVEQFRRMDEVGIFPPDTRAELVCGEFLLERRQRDAYYRCVIDLTGALAARDDKPWLVSVRNPLHVSPDTLTFPAVVLMPCDATLGIPTPATARIVIEIADIVPEYTFNIKVPLYAAATVRELWVVDLENERLVVFTEPQAGHYEKRRVVERGEQLTSPIVPELALAIETILPR
jgi:Uma2 family endonuclease